MSNIMDVIHKGEIYLTFVFDGMDSTQMGVASVTNGGGYDTPILPVFNDNFWEVDGYNGRYYFNTRSTHKEFSFQCFIDNLSASQFDEIKAWLRQDKIAKLIVPETPFRYHWVKVAAIENLDNIPLTHPDTGGVSYTGRFSVTFTTIGQTAGYGMFYYQDDLKYFEYKDIFEDTHFYDAGLLYREESIPMTYVVQDKGHVGRVYNPGTYAGKLRLNILAKTPISGGSIVITNKTIGDMSVIRLEDLVVGSNIIVDYAKNEYTINGQDASKFVVGDLIYLSPRSHIERIDNAAVYNDGTNTRVKFDALGRQVRTEDIGKTVMFKNEQDINAIDGAGGKITRIDTADNSFVLEVPAGLWTNPSVNVIITQLDELETVVTLPSGEELELKFELQPRYI